MTRKKVSSQEKEEEKDKAEFGSAIAQICEEKGISKEKVIETIEAALAAAYKKDYGKRGQNIRSVFDEVSGSAKFFLVKEVVDELTREFPIETEEDNKEQSEENKKNVFKKEAKPEKEEEKIPRFNPERDLRLEEAKKIKKDAQVGDIIETELEQKEDYGRVAAQTAKQVIIQRIREAERDAMFEEYKNKEGEVVSGIVQRIEGRNVFVDLGKSIGVLFPSEQIEREDYRIGQRIKVYIASVDAGSKGPGITLSRVHPEMVKVLFELEVPEIFSGVVEIKSIAREAGQRTKIAVFSQEEGVDPIGSCVGQKGTRVQAIIDELNGEKIDIILWNENSEKFISAALSPAKVLKIELDEGKKEAITTVPEDQLSLAIGKRGQNVRLAAKLTDWKIDIVGVGLEGKEIDPKEVAEKKSVESVEKMEDIKEVNKENSENKIENTNDSKDTKEMDNSAGEEKSADEKSKKSGEEVLGETSK